MTGMRLPSLAETLAVLGADRGTRRDAAGLHGHVVWGTFDDGEDLVGLGWAENLVTQVGDQYYGERAAGISSPPGQVTGMRLGTGTTAVAKTGAGAAIVTYQAASQVAIDATWPKSSLVTNSRQIQWQTTWAAGVATANGLAEAVITDESPLTDSAGTAGNTISRVLLSPTVNKGALDTLVIQWNHQLLGA